MRRAGDESGPHRRQLLRRLLAAVGCLTSAACVESPRAAAGSPSASAAAAATTLPWYTDATLEPRWLPAAELRAGRVHRVGDFRLVDQGGRVVTADSLDGVAHVARFFFTRCGDVCPIVQRRLRAVERAFDGEPGLRLVSFAVGGASDSVGALAAYARVNDLRPPRWWLLTGTRDEVARLARESYLVGLGRGASYGVDSVAHTEMLVLVDRDRRIRGVYNGTLELEVEQLIADVRTLLAVPAAASSAAAPAVPLSRAPGSRQARR